MAGPASVREVDVSGVPTEFDQSVVLLDVREDDEWERGHAAGAHHIPMGDVPARMAEIDRGSTLFVVCHLGGRSLRVARYLAQNGYEPVNVTGGMQAWADAGRAVVTDGGGTGVV
jgi:rhodanese-related sulfurtransferase